MEVWKKYEKDLIKPEGYRRISRLQDFKRAKREAKLAWSHVNKNILQAFQIFWLEIPSIEIIWWFLSVPLDHFTSIWEILLGLIQGQVAE